MNQTATRVVHRPRMHGKATEAAMARAIGREPCWICGSTRSRRSREWGGRVVCDANANGRDRCREREVARMIEAGR